MLKNSFGATHPKSTCSRARQGEFTYSPIYFFISIAPKTHTRSSFGGTNPNPEKFDWFLKNRLFCENLRLSIPNRAFVQFFCRVKTKARSFCAGL